MKCVEVFSLEVKTEEAIKKGEIKMAKNHLYVGSRKFNYQRNQDGTYNFTDDSLRAAHMLQVDNIQGTVKSFTDPDANGSYKIQHKDSNGVVLREDVYTSPSPTKIQVVRTMNTGERMTIIYDDDAGTETASAITKA